MIESLLLVPLAAAIFGLVTIRRPKIFESLSPFIFALSIFLCLFAFKKISQTGPLVFQWGEWRAPFGITFVADYLSLTVLTAMNAVAFVVSLGASKALNQGRRDAGFFVFLSFLMFGATGALLTGDFFNLYVWFEVLLVTSFALMALGADSAQLRGTSKYLVINLLGSLIFLAGAGLLYSFFGTLNMAEVAYKIREVGYLGSPWAPLVSAFLLVAFCLKAGTFPFFGWLPVSYPTPPALLTALFSAILTKVGVYILIRTYGMIFPVPRETLIVLACVTMLVGVFGALSQTRLKNLLSFHIISQTGYMVLGIALHSSLAIGAAILHVLHNIIVKTNLLLMTSRIENHYETDDLKKLGGLSRHSSFLTFNFLISALALAGLPPLSGFWSKLGILKAAWTLGDYVVFGIALVTGLLTLFSMMKIWMEAFWKPSEAKRIQKMKFLPSLDLPILFFSFVALTSVLYIGPLMDFLVTVGGQILNPEVYGRAVLGRWLP